MLPIRSRLLLATSAVLLGLLFVLPVWQVTLVAPQYPEGLGMRIWLDTITGLKPNDLNNINNLNRYIGMRRIVPESIPELRFMPGIAGGLVAAGLAAALTRRRALAQAFVIAFLLFAVAGLADFWRWTYDYGHNLDLEHAIIKVPGMTYQPPLIGTTQLLNFTATSLPAIGGLCAFVALALALLALYQGRAGDAPGRGVVLLALVAHPALAQDTRRDTLHVGPTRTYTSIASAMAAARPHALVLVDGGLYREPTIVVDRPVHLVAVPGDTATIDGEGQRGLLLVRADDVTVEALHWRRTGTSQLDERAAIRVRDVARCRIINNHVVDAQFGIVVERTRDCEITGNTVRGPEARQTSAGNGIHAWSSQRPVVRDNRVTGHRDGIYFEFVTGGHVEDNLSEHSARYGMHFMFSDDCRYARNTFQDNGNGVAVMYSKRVVMQGNTFSRSLGGAAYGLLLKDIDDSEVSGNRFLSNSTGLYLEDAGRNRVLDNLFRDNGWALRTLASAQENLFEGNVFEQNAFDVTTNSRSAVSTFRANYWDRYRGYDLDRNGTGDVPHVPVRLFALVVEQSPAAAMLLRSILVDLLDLAERAFPALAPASIRDAAPLIRRPVLLPAPPRGTT